MKNTIDTRDTSTPSSANQVPIFSFANGEKGPISNTLIRGIEKVTGQPKIKRLYVDYVNEERPDHLFWQDAVDRLSLKVNLHFDPNAYIPEKGRLLIVANHPFGVIDGLIVCSEISKIRQDYKIITHQVLRQSPAVMHQILPVDFDDTTHALDINIQTRKSAIEQIKNNGALIIFPSGSISLRPKFIGRAQDHEWKTFASKLALMEDTITLPIFFSGQNSIIYTTARKFSETLGYSLMFREIAHKIGSEIDVTIRKPIHSSELRRFKDRNEVTAYLRSATYGDN